MDLNPDIYFGKYDGTDWLWRKFPLVIDGEKIMYRKCDGLEAVGKIKNVYTESYADSGVERVDFPETLTREPVDVTLSVVVKRHDEFSNNAAAKLLGMFSNGLTVFWDSIRQKAAVLLFTEATRPEKDTYLGMNILTMDIKFKNIAGDSFHIYDEFANDHLPAVEALTEPIIQQALS